MLHYIVCLGLMIFSVQEQFHVRLQQAVPCNVTELFGACLFVCAFLKLIYV